MRFFVLALTFCSFTRTAAALPIEQIASIQHATIQKLEAKLVEQEVQINQLRAFAPRLLVSKSAGNCEFDFGGNFLSVHTQTRVTVGIFNIVPSNAVFIINRLDDGRMGFQQISNNSPRNNDGNIEVSGTRIIATVGGIGASCSITMQRVF